MDPRQQGEVAFPAFRNFIRRCSQSKCAVGSLDEDSQVAHVFVHEIQSEVRSGCCKPPSEQSVGLLRLTVHV